MYSYTATYVSAFVQRCEANMTLQLTQTKKDASALLPLCPLKSGHVRSSEMQPL